MFPSVFCYTSFGYHDYRWVAHKPILDTNILSSLCGEQQPLPWIRHDQEIGPDGTKPLPEPRLTSHQWGSVSFTLASIHCERRGWFWYDAFWFIVNWTLLKFKSKQKLSSEENVYENITQRSDCSNMYLFKWKQTCPTANTRSIVVKWFL